MVRSVSHDDKHTCTLMQGPRSGGQRRAGTLEPYQGPAHTHPPTPVIAERYDATDPDHKAQMAKMLRRGQLPLHADGGPMSMFGD